MPHQGPNLDDDLAVDGRAFLCVRLKARLYARPNTVWDGERGLVVGQTLDLIHHNLHETEVARQKVDVGHPENLSMRLDHGENFLIGSQLRLLAECRTVF